ncbi:MAG: TetR/AcrR family transcriptional regulator [Deltaproteobacteria bacterium]|nr:TetR/AcrR family transcriptional regulator [Deltaproteobacteria bacterium]
MARSAASPPLEGQKTTERILDAAENLFSEYGFAGTAIRDIASEVSLNPASLYNHFDGKESLYEAVLERVLQPIFLFIERSAGTTWTEAEAERTITLIMEYLKANPNLARLLCHESLAGGNHMRRIIGQTMRPLVADGIAALRRGPAEESWSEDELPMVFSAFIHLIVGHFVLAPVLSAAMDTDGLTPEATDRQTTFLHKVTKRLLLPYPDPSATSDADAPTTEGN